MGVFLTNLLPAQASLVSTSAPQGTISSGSNVVVAAFGTLASNGVARLDMRLRFTNPATFMATNRAQAASSTPELFPASDVATLVFPVWSDDDRDGLADDWEVAFFGTTTALNGGSGADFDGDGIANLGEHLAGTDPADAANLLRVTSLTVAGSTISLRFHAATDHRYQLQRSAALTGPWMTVAPWCPGEGFRVGVVDLVPNPAVPWFFRVMQLPY